MMIEYTKITSTSSVSLADTESQVRCTEVSLKPRPQVVGDAPVSPPQLRLQPPLSCSILFLRFVVSRKKTNEKTT